MQKQRGAATWMHLMGFDNVKISISTKKSEDLHKVFPEINRYIKCGGGFNFCKETATFIMQFAASPVAGENTKFSIRSKKELAQYLPSQLRKSNLREQFSR